MKRVVTITIEVDMESDQCNQWHDHRDYFNESVREALEKIQDSPIKNRSGKIKTDSELAEFKVHVQTTN